MSFRNGEPCAREVWVKAFERRKPDGRPRWLLRSTVAGWIALHARTDATRAAVGLGVIADVTGSGERTVKRALAEVKAEGWLLVRERGHYRQAKGKPKGEGRPAATVYDLDIPESLRATYGLPVENWREGVSTGHESVSTGHGHAQNGHPQEPKGSSPESGRAAGATPAPHNFEPGVGDLCRCGLPERNQRHKIKSAARGTR